LCLGFNKTNKLYGIRKTKRRRRKAVAAAIQTQSQIIASFLIRHDREKQERQKKLMRRVRTIRRRKRKRKREKNNSSFYTCVSEYETPKANSIHGHSKRYKRQSINLTFVSRHLSDFF
jgi:hypothetical protein